MNSDEMISLMYTAKRPWNTGGVVEYCEIRHRKTSKSCMFMSGNTDTQEQIDKCLSCTMLDCTNCVEDGQRRTLYALKKVLPGQESLFDERMTM